jgi:hypothetical protein
MVEPPATGGANLLRLVAPSTAKTNKEAVDEEAHGERDEKGWCSWTSSARAPHG